MNNINNVTKGKVTM